MLTPTKDAGTFALTRLPKLYTYPYDFTPYARLLAQQTVGDPVTQSFVELLAKVTGDPWTLTPKDPYTFFGAKVFYLGKNHPTFPTVTRFAYVLGIELSVRYQAQRLYLVFNVLKDA